MGTVNSQHLCSTQDRWCRVDGGLSGHRQGAPAGGFTELEVNIWPKAGSTDTTHGAAERQIGTTNYTCVHRWICWTSPIDATFRYISSIDNPNDAVPDYEELDLRLAWSPTQPGNLDRRPKSSTRLPFRIWQFRQSPRD